MHKVEQVFCENNYLIHVRFDDGVTGVVDMSKIHFRGLFAPLADPVFFQQASVVDGVVTWPNQADLAPDAMYDAIRQTGRWQLNG